VLLSRPFGVLAAFAVAVLVIAFFSPGTARGVAVASVAYVGAVATLVWRRFNGGWRLQVGEAADGLRLRFGALETTAETIPRGRVQAVVRAEPVAWRPMGWVRLQLDVAGHARGREERQSDTRELRTVVPAGTPADAERLLDRILPARPGALRPAPPRARWKSPLRYHWLGYDWNPEIIVVTSGRITRRTTWVPLARVQSLRLVQGPVQRRLRLASVHVDAAGKRVTAVVRDRDVTEAERLLADLAEACRRAREPLRRPA
jgi:putative membrane protein